MIAELMALEAVAAQGVPAHRVEDQAGEQDAAAAGRHSALLRASNVIAFPLYELAS